MPIKVNKPGEIEVGDFFESCNFHPCLCSSIEQSKVQVEGISLVNGEIVSCNIKHCGLIILNLQEALEWKISGPCDVELDLEEQWWTK